MTWGQLSRRSRVSLKQITMAAQGGGISAATVPHRVKRHLQSISCKAVALRRVTHFAEADKRIALEQAGRMDLFEPHRRKIRWRYEEKGIGRHRKVCDLPQRLRVGQHMAKELIRARHTPREHIFDWPDRGGCPGAVARTRVAIDEGYRFLVVADIRDCYENFNPAYIYQTNLLPPELVRATLDSRQLRYGLMGSFPNGHDNTEKTCPRGLLQGGAASSCILAYALDDLPDYLTSDVVPIVQSDNMILACRSQQECEAAANALVRFLRDNPAGMFSPRVETFWMRGSPLIGNGSTATRWPHRFEQFGYSFQLGKNAQCEVGLSRPNLINVAGRLAEYLDGSSTHQSSIETFDEKLQELLAGFPALTTNGYDFVSTLLEPGFTVRRLAQEVAGAHSQSGDQINEPPWGS